MDDQPPAAMLLLSALSHAEQGLGRDFGQPIWGSLSRSLGAGFLAGTAHGAALAGQQVYDLLLLVPVLDAASQTAVARLFDRVQSSLDRERSAAIVGRERLELAGTGPLQVVMAWRRSARLSTCEAQAIWHDEHGKIVRGHGSAMGYRQLHADPQRSAGLSRMLGFGGPSYDGAVLTHADTLPALAATFSHPGVGGTALADERRFIDHSRSTLQAFEPLKAS